MMIGTILGGRYEILETVGSGGMAVVYKAKCRLLGREVAVKMLREELQSDKDFVERFKAEARSAASLNHPNVVSVYDVGTDGDREYFVMEYIDGITLKEIIDSRQLGWKAACSYAVQIAGAIEHAHRKNIVHRDIKPHNIMITKDNVVKVTDFGIARAVTNSTIVRAGNVIGSVHYFSPEQACGGAVDFKSDIYSMGVVLYEMLTGRVPFDAENPVAIAKMHVDNEATPPMEYNPEIPESVNDIVLKAMAKQPAKRYQTPVEMAEDLKNVISNPESISIKDADATQFVPVVTPAEREKETSGVDKIIIKGGDDEEDKGRKTASKAAWIGAILVFIISLLIILGALKPELFKSADMIEVPMLLGKTVDEAMKICDDMGVVFEDSQGDYSNEYGEGQIMEQAPGAGMHKKVEKITVKISRGPEKITLDNYVGKDVGVVKNELKRLGIDVIIEEVQHESLPIDTIVKHSPREGSTIKAGSTVTLYVSTGEEDTIVPSITGSTLERAKAALEAVGLKLGSVTYIENENMVDKVTDQTILEGTQVKSGTEVDVQVGKMPEKPPVVEDVPPATEIVDQVVPAE